MKVVVSCSTYGRLPFLPRMLASFLSQTHEDKHLVIINDEGEVKIRCEYPNVTCINLNERLSIGRKRNLAWELMPCDFIQPFDDDDILLPNKITRGVNFLKDNPEYSSYLNKSGLIIYGDDCMYSTAPPSTFALFTYNAWKEVGGYANSSHGEDVEFYNKMPNNFAECDENNLDYFYVYGGVNYHASSNEDYEHISKRQLDDMNLRGKTYNIIPDFVQFNKFVELSERYKLTKSPIRVLNPSMGNIELS